MFKESTCLNLYTQGRAFVLGLLNDQGVALNMNRSGNYDNPKATKCNIIIGQKIASITFYQRKCKNVN